MILTELFNSHPFYVLLLVFEIANKTLAAITYGINFNKISCIRNEQTSKPRLYPIFIRDTKNINIGIDLIV